MNKIFRIENIRNACFSFSYSIVIHRFCFVFRHEECLSWKNLKKKEEEILEKFIFEFERNDIVSIN